MLKQLAALLVLALGLPLAACAQDQAPAAPAPVWVEGVHYTRLDQPLFSPYKGKVEVVEFFMHSCGHCYTFEPLVQAWKKNLPENVVFTYSPAPWGAVRELHARAYYTALALGVTDTMHPVMFDALIKQRKALNTEDDLAELFADNGVDEEAFHKAFNSFGVTGQLRQADARIRGAKVSGTPALVVAGQYKIGAKEAGGHENMLRIASYLVDKELAAMAAAE